MTDTPKTRTVLLVDLSSIAHPAYHANKNDPNPNAPSEKTYARVVDLANGNPFVAVCIDKGRSFRREIDERYKAQRPEKDAALSSQIEMSIEKLEADGFPIFGLDGMEADDIIAAGVKHFTTKHDDVKVVICSSDKDLTSLITEDGTVLQKTMSTGTIMDHVAVREKFGVKPSQMIDWLTLVGDASDNIQGVPGIGPKNATELLSKYGTLDDLFVAVGQNTKDLPAKIKEKLTAFYAGSFEVTRKLVTLKPDIDGLEFDRVFDERKKQDGTPAQEPMAFADNDDSEDSPALPPSGTLGTTADAGAQQSSGPGLMKRLQSPPSIHGELVDTKFELQYEPKRLRDAMLLADNLHNSRLFLANHPNAQAVLTVLITGRELGLSTMASMRGIHIIESKPALSAQLMVALILKSGLAKYWEVEESDETQCTIATFRKKARKERKMTYTIDMAKKMFNGEFKANSNWLKTPMQMLNARCSAFLAREVYPDLLFGMYTPEELMEVRQERI